MKFYFKEFLVVFAIVAVTVFVLGRVWVKQSQVVQVGNTKIPVEIVTSQSELTKGLSGRISLDSNSGMLFILPQKGIYSFWMKDMLFPIDIIWIADNKIIAIDNSIPLEPNGTNLKTYSPPETVDYVLELNAGFAIKHNFKKGDAITLPPRL